MPTMAAPSAGYRSSSAAASALNEYALVWNAVTALSGGVVMKRPPSASSGANAIACRTPSTRPQRSRSSAASASSSSGSLTSSSSTSGGSGSRAAERSVMRLARPKPVRTISAPASWAWRATSKAIDSRLMTPVMSSFLPSSMPITAGSGRSR